MNPISQNYYSQRLRLHYVEWGDAKAEPILMIHGGLDHCRNWDWVAQALSSNYNIIAPDLRGHGDSDWSASGSYRQLDFVHDLTQLVHVKGYKKITIIAHSFGGFISLMYAGINPEIVDKMIIIEGLIKSKEEIENSLSIPVHQRLTEWMDSVYNVSSRQVKRYPSFAEALARMRSENGHLDDERAIHLTRHALKQNEDSTYSWKYDNYIHALYPDHEYIDLYSLWQRISCPILMLRGEDSFAVDPEVDGRIKHFQNVSTVNIPQAGHWLHHDQFDRFMTEVEGFLAK
ncbi:Tropinesterase [Zhongshania aliphaticivorans]|uniref:Tropinesterase n=1 Tax=Zhongshania aliphaticivorans TaxID=1470434 RepID=A0A5S9Q1D5_9GAMM|nr:alpha/beta hydrolase [Zhongshania aliphaticivorans]CAA0093406.1 Tropinesterase [Zhongshania aliphaticivorans]CAA0111305.1 Tropinesterase [Zhongshania aliphaticivorans]